jgi:hypothetical protein
MLNEGIDFYWNENGLMVLTREYHLARGHCCKNGCKHCPYDFESKQNNFECSTETDNEKMESDK